MGLMNSGVKQWVFQRTTNALIVTFGVFLVYLFSSGQGLTYDSLTGLLTASGVGYYLALVLVLSCLNSVLAAWQIDGDYARKFGLPALLLTVIAAIVSLVYLGYGLKILFA